MKTTLKRGIGRAAELNGNGRAVFPPGVIAPMRRYRQPEPPRRTGLQFVGRILVWLVILVAVVAAGIAGGAYMYLNDFVSGISAHSRAVKIAEKKLNVDLPGQPAIALLIGYDHRLGAESSNASRSDTMMLLRADPATKTVSMLSFPRDLLVPLICPGKPSYVDRINAAYALCGPQGSLLTVKAITHLPINYLITVDFHGFKEIVDHLGGVWMDVDRRYFNKNVGSADTNYANIDLQPGYQLLNGSDALDFVRYRHTDSDLYRLARQQQFVRAMREQMSHALSPTRLVFTLPKLVASIRNNVEVGRGGGQGLDRDTLLRWAFFFYGLPPGHFFQTRLTNLSVGNTVSAPQSSIDDAVHSFLSPDVSAPTKATAAALGEKLLPTRALIPPARISVVVLNGTTTPRLASDTSYRLTLRGYHTVVPPNQQPADAPPAEQGLPATEVLFDPAQPGSRPAAAQLANVLGATKVAPLSPDVVPLTNGAQTAVILGTDFHGTLAPAPVQTIPVHQPAQVALDPQATLPLLKSVQPRLPFRLEVPRLLERHSTLSTRTPVREYAIAPGHKAIRLVYQLNGLEFWGIEETNWAGAPVLGERNFKRHFGGREFDFYYSGSHLHMVVLKQNGATYWVINSLLDSMSNETMIAIAKGLVPLAR